MDEVIVETGEVVFSDRSRGFGFIRPDLGGKDVFVARSGIVGGEIPAQGERVRFLVRTGPKGKPEAMLIR